MYEPELALCLTKNVLYRLLPTDVFRGVLNHDYLVNF